MSHDALFQLGMGSVLLKSSQTEEQINAMVSKEIPAQADHFIERDGVRCAGAHLIIDLFEAEKLDDIDHIAQTMIDCVNAAGATLLHIHLHPFEPNGGVSGVAVLAESHISIHSWPENGYAALDVFMCGDAQPEKCVEVLRKAFRPDRIEVKEILRGQGA
ncbi:MAG TPA: adenosylmethionine decarboxylase [Xanthobacteraceae bacterium]|nr:adenosylmethionine decarboxylase [Xanthobacteraceae bacterium]